MGYRFATLVVEEEAAEWLFRYVFYGKSGIGQLHILLRTAKDEVAIPSISGIVHAADWHERETEDLFGVTFTGHPRLGDFVLHEEWPEDVNPMRSGFNAMFHTGAGNWTPNGGRRASSRPPGRL